MTESSQRCGQPVTPFYRGEHAGGGWA